MVLAARPVAVTSQWNVVRLAVSCRSGTLAEVSRGRGVRNSLCAETGRPWPTESHSLAKPLAPPGCAESPRAAAAGTWALVAAAGSGRPVGAEGAAPGSGRTGAGERKVSRAQTGRVWTTAARAVPIHPPASRAVAFVSPKAASERPTRGPGPGACGAWPGASVPPGSPWPGLGRAPPGPSRPGSALPDGGRAPSLSSVPPASHRGSGTFPRGASGLRLQAGNRGHLETEESNATFLDRRMAWRTLFQADSFDCSGSIIMHVSLLNVAL